MKITRAMELIATSRIARARVRVAEAQPYTAKMTDVIRNIAAAGGLSHPLLERREVTTAGVFVVTSDRGLAGGYNSNVLRLAERALNAHRANNVPTRLFTVGAKAQGYFRYRGYDIEESFLGVTDTPTYGDARAIANVLLDDYEQARMDSVEVYTTRFVSALTQTPVLWPLLPIDGGGLVRRYGAQAVLKYRAAVDMLSTLGYKALTFGTDDLRLPVTPRYAAPFAFEGDLEEVTFEIR